MQRVSLLLSRPISVDLRLSTANILLKIHSRTFHLTSDSQQPCRYDDDRPDVTVYKELAEEVEKRKKLEKELCDVRSLLAKIDLYPDALKLPDVHQSMMFHIDAHRQHRLEDHQATVRALEVKIAAVAKELDGVASQKNNSEARESMLRAEFAKLTTTLDKVQKTSYLSSQDFLDRHSDLEEEVSKALGKGNS